MTKPWDTTCESAIEKAALAINRKGKRCSHQRRLKKAALKQACRSLVDESGPIEQAEDFDGLFRLIRAAVNRFPESVNFYVYDTALRIGAKLNLFPTRVYLHAGTRRGPSGWMTARRRSMYLRCQRNSGPWSPMSWRMFCASSRTN
jgi:hypothetical protein